MTTKEGATEEGGNNASICLDRPPTLHSKEISRRRFRGNMCFRTGLFPGSRKYHNKRSKSNIERSSTVVKDDSTDPRQPPLAVKRYIGGYSSRLEQLSGDFIYRRDPLGQALDECPRVSMAVVDKAIVPVEIVTEFGKEEKKSLPAYYYTQSGRQPIKKKQGNGVSKDSIKSPNSSPPPSPRFQPKHRGSREPLGGFASPDRNFQIYFLPQKQNILKFDIKDQGNGYALPSKMHYFSVSRDSTDLSREVSNMTLNTTNMDAMPSLPGIIHDHPRSAKSAFGRDFGKNLGPFRLQSRVASFD